MSLRDKMLAVIDDVNGSVAEREELVEMIAIALLTRKNLFVLGEPGQAKSYAINLFRRHITGARQFERLLSKQSDEEQLFGRVDLSSLIPGSIPDSALENDDIYQNLRFDLNCAVDGLGQRKNAPETFTMLGKAADLRFDLNCAVDGLGRERMRLKPSPCWAKPRTSWRPTERPWPCCITASRSCRPPARSRRRTSCCSTRSSSAMMVCSTRS